MKVSDYIVKFFEDKGVHDFFGFQGTMIAHLVDSIGNSKTVVNHSVYNEQAASFAACGYAKSTGKCSVAYSTSGPGALNLISGIADAYYDSVPVFFITGQVNTTEYTNIPELRQQAFQETEIVSIVKSITKYASFVDDAGKISEELERAWKIANTGRKGPVLLDIPMNIQRAKIDIKQNKLINKENIKRSYEKEINQIKKYITGSNHPVILIGNGISKTDDSRNNVRCLIHNWNIPVISTLLGSDILSYDDKLNFGVIGSAYGHRSANWIACKKADLIIGLGASLCKRQTGVISEDFAPNAKIIRIDIDETELKRTVHRDDIKINVDVNELIAALKDIQLENKHSSWIRTCQKIKHEMQQFDTACPERVPNKIIAELSELAGENAIVTCDVGQHMMWCMQSFKVKSNRMIYSGGHGAMGFALPAAIGAYYGNDQKKNVMCIAGDGAFQMNIQELQWVVREQIPVCIVVLNNNALGLIRQQQDDFFSSRHYGALETGGYNAPSFKDIATAYGVESIRITNSKELYQCQQKIYRVPLLLEIMLPNTTVAAPKTYFGQTMVNQKPYISMDLYTKLEKM